jgi:hypothetical protein
VAHRLKQFAAWIIRHRKQQIKLMINILSNLRECRLQECQSIPHPALGRIKGLRAFGGTLRAKADFLNPRLGIFQALFTLGTKGIALRVKRNRFIKAGIARFKARNDDFKALERIFK